MIYRDRNRGYYTMIANSFLRDPSITLTERGLFALMLSRPDSWEFSELVLSKEQGVPVSEIRTLLESLERKGYAKRRAIRGGEVWDLIEKPGQETRLRHTAKPKPARTALKTDDYGLTFGEIAKRMIEQNEQAKERKREAAADL